MEIKLSFSTKEIDREIAIRRQERELFRKEDEKKDVESARRISRKVSKSATKLSPGSPERINELARASELWCGANNVRDSRLEAVKANEEYEQKVSEVLSTARAAKLMSQGKLDELDWYVRENTHVERKRKEVSKRKAKHAAMEMAVAKDKLKYQHKKKVEQREVKKKDLRLRKQAILAISLIIVVVTPLSLLAIIEGEAYVQNKQQTVIAECSNTQECKESYEEWMAKKEQQTQEEQTQDGQTETPEERRERVRREAREEYSYYNIEEDEHYQAAKQYDEEHGIERDNWHV